MYQLMIVDDETSVVDSLALTIPWNEYGIKEVYRAYSAQEALNIATKHQIDILITDIQMPETDGFGLIEKMNDLSPKIKSIILSGHDDFKYAQKAIKHQAIDYLLKPVNIKVLIATVEKTVQNIEKELIETISYERMKHTLDINMPLLKDQLLYNMLKGNELESKYLERKLSAIDTSFRSGDSFKMMVIGMEDGFPGYDLQSMSLLKFAVNNIAEEVFREKLELWGCTTDQGYLVFVLKGKSRDGLQLVASEVIKLQRYVQNYLKGSLTICLSNIGIFPHDLEKTYQKAMTTIRRNEGINENNFITVNDAPIKTNGGNTINLHESPTITSLLESGDWEGAIDRISHILFINDEKSEPSQNHLFKVLLYLSYSFSSLLQIEEETIEEMLGEGFHLLTRKNSLITKQRVFDWAEKMIHNIRKQSSNHIDDSQKRIVAVVRSFIRQNLSEDTSLQVIAEYADLHPVYLSKVYKEATNETIGDYIYQLRMDRADHLLKNSKLKIADISNELGFFSQSHFIKVFRKRYGCTPQQYRHKKPEALAPVAEIK